MQGESNTVLSAIE